MLTIKTLTDNFEKVVVDTDVADLPVVARIQAAFPANKVEFGGFAPRQQLCIWEGLPQNNNNSSV